MPDPEFITPELGEPYLLTPGPLTTTFAVKQAMLKDWGSWDGDFRAMTAELRSRLVAMLGNSAAKMGFDCVPIQGSGTFCVEAMIGTFLPRDGKALVLANGAYGLRAAEICRVMGRDHVVLDKGDYLPPRGNEVGEILAADPEITHVIAIHCETSSGILNPLYEIADAVQSAGRKLLIDSMSAFGACPVDPGEIQFEALVSSANKCIEGVPGFGFVLVRQDILKAAKGNAHSLSLDLTHQWEVMEKTGQWRFTPPTHVVAAFLKALDLYEAEGGQPARLARYTKNRDTLVAGMRQTGFETLLADDWLSPIITTFFCPADTTFDFASFYEGMKARGFIIYPGKLTVVDSFRLGHIGAFDHHVMADAVMAAKETLSEMGVASAAPSADALIEKQNAAEQLRP